MNIELETRIIAEFMGWQDCDATSYEYHSSWKWLMTAWGKAYNKLLDLNLSTCRFYIEDMKNALIIPDREKAYEVLVSTIEFINKETKN